MFDPIFLDCKATMAKYVKQEMDRHRYRSYLVKTEKQRAGGGRAAGSEPNGGICTPPGPAISTIAPILRDDGGCSVDHFAAASSFVRGDLRARTPVTSPVSEGL